MSNNGPAQWRLRAEREWETVLRAGSSEPLPLCLARELASYTQEPVPAVLRKMESGCADFARLWRDRGVEATDPAALRAFYNAGLTEAYELLHWHAGGLGRCPTQHVVAAWLGREIGARRVLDYGAGPGSAAILLAEHGFQVALADISEPLLGFAEWRLKARGVAGAFHLLPDDPPPRSAFDLVLCIDVLEHVPDQAALVAEVAEYLHVGGVLVATVYEDSRSAERPMHISSTGPVADFARRTPLWVDWDLTARLRELGGWTVAFRKLPAGRTLRAVERCVGRAVPQAQRSAARRLVQSLMSPGEAK